MKRPETAKILNNIAREKSRTVSEQECYPHLGGLTGPFAPLHGSPAITGKEKRREPAQARTSWTRDVVWWGHVAAWDVLVARDPRLLRSSMMKAQVRAEMCKGLRACVPSELAENCLYKRSTCAIAFLGRV